MHFARSQRATLNLRQPIYTKSYLRQRLGVVSESALGLASFVPTVLVS